MMQFWIAALALGLVAAAVVLVPAISAWAKQGEDRSSSTLGVGILVALAIPVVSIMLYSNWSTWDWGSGGMQQRAQGPGGNAEHAEMDQAIAALESRLQQQPEEMESWVLLGRSYMSRRRFEDAAGAFRNAVALDTNEAPQLLADYGEALALSDPEGLQGEAGVVIERVLALNPENAKGLWYGGLNAFENARWDLAIERLSKLLTLNPPETLIPLIEERIESAKAQSEGGMPGMTTPVAGAPAAATPPVTRDAAPETAPEASEPPPVATAQEPPMDPSEGIRVEVTLDANLSGALPGPAPLFIFARPLGGGPPLAAIRAGTDELPMSLVLTDDNAMMQGVTILDQPELELVARVSLGGTPAERPGDLYGTVEYVREEGGPVRIVIDRIAE